MHQGSGGDGLVMICDNDSIHHARAVTAYLEDHPAWSCSTTPGQLLATAAPGPAWLAPRYEQNFWNAA